MKISPFKRLLLAAIIGAGIGWLVSEPWENEFSYGRDLFIMISVSFFIWLFLSVYNYIYFRKFDLLKEKKKQFLFVLIPVIGSILIKAMLTPAAEKIYLIDRTTDERILLLDVSSSMEGEKIIELKDAITQYLNFLIKSKSKDMVGIITFSDDATLISRPTTNYDELKEIVSQLQVEGGTNMSAGLNLARSEMKNDSAYVKNDGKSEIILASDGMPNSPETVREIVSDNFPYPISAIGIGADYDGNALRQITSSTNGTFYDANDIAKLQPIFQKVAEKSGIVEIDKDKGSGKENISFFNRLFAWALYGLFIGMSLGLFEDKRKEIVIGSVGGFVGGILGGLFLILFGWVGLAGPINRFVTFTIFSVMLAIALWTTRKIYNHISIIKNR